MIAKPFVTWSSIMKANFQNSFVHSFFFLIIFHLSFNTKTEYHSKLAAKLVNSSTSGKTYWSILKTFANGRKIPVISPLMIPVIPPLLINNEFISNFKTKANYFNKFFYQQFTGISIGIGHWNYSKTQKHSSSFCFINNL